MRANKIELQSFRNVPTGVITFNDGINILIGDNAQGKTNALEAVYLFAQGRSFRTGKEREYIMHGADFARLSLYYNAAGREQKSDLCYLKNGRKGVKRNGVTLSKLSEFIGSFRAVMFCPEHLDLIKDGPAMRRRFLDGAISQLDGSYLRAVQNYHKILAQRNKLLSSYPKDEGAIAATLPLWDEQLAFAGEIISEKRGAYTEEIGKSAAEFFSEMTAGKEKPEFRYREVRTKEQLLALFEANRDKDLRFGTTNGGVHKDDITVTLNGTDARAFASQGQQRSLALAMKLAEADHSEKATGERPVLLLDDVLSELDETRKKFVLTGIKKGQVIITACEKEIFRDLSGNFITVEGGIYR